MDEKKIGNWNEKRKTGRYEREEEGGGGTGGKGPWGVAVLGEDNTGETVVRRDRV